MTKYINEETLRKLMYEEAFGKDSDMQKWDSGCWIRYKLFENCLEAVPAEDVTEIKHGHWVKTTGENGVTSACCCNLCGFEDNRFSLFNYCPKCGTKMDEETNE